QLGQGSVRREVAVPNAGDERRGRFDFLIARDGHPPCYVEVKSVTLLLDGSWGAFPDAVSVRATRHVMELARVRQTGGRAVLLFCVQHTGVRRVRPADHIDPSYGTALRDAATQGVEVLAYSCVIDRSGIAIGCALPVIL
ncbi:MAG: DNA/RNA nuclease SfsA, partial [Gammaproteobacteria bacterium]|nr:DNA/RNA nuclease SfsA [Gammaproteobacteria bacterium]